MAWHPSATTHTLHCGQPTVWRRRLGAAAGGILLLCCAILAARAWAPIDAQAQTPARTNRNAAPQQNRTPARQASSGDSKLTPAATDVVAVVNSEAITKQQLSQECLRRYGEEMLESMVNKQLISEACRQHGVQVTQQDIDHEIENMAAKFNLSVDRWLTMLQEERNIPAEKYRREVIWPMIALRRLAAGDIQVTEQELQQAFEAEYGPKVRVRMIATRTRREADQLLAMVQQEPEKFGQIAKEHSADPNSAAARGIIPPIRKHVGDPEVERVVFALKEGEISPVVEAPGQFLIFMVEQQVPATFVAVNHVPEIKQQLAERIRDSKLRESSNQRFQKLQESATIVNVFNDRELRAKHPGVAAMLNGRPIPLELLAEECTAYYSREVLQGEINRMVIQQALARAGLSMSRDDLEAEVLRAAASYGYVKTDGTPDRAAWIQSVQEEDGQSEEIYLRDVVWPSAALKKLVGSRVQVSDDDLRKGFESNYGERADVQAIVLGNQRQAIQVFEQAKANNTEQFFGELAFQYSIEPMSKANYGKVPPIRRHSGNPTLEEEAFSLGAGELSGVVASGDKFVLMRGLGRTKPVVQDFSDVKDELHRDIYEKKLRVEMSREMDQLYSAAQIDNFLTQSVQLGKESGNTRR